MRKVLRQENDLTEYMKQDLETLYLFGNILLDQWSLLAVYIGGLNKPEKFSLHRLVEKLQSGNAGILAPLWQKQSKEMLWLYYQLRLYRNRFVVHANRPWQRGTTRSVYGDDFNLFIPTPPGWVDDQRANEEIRKLLGLAPKWLQNARGDYWEKANPRALIERLFNYIGEIEKKEDRDKVAELFTRVVGGSTPTFQVMGTNLLQFIETGTGILFEIAKSNVAKINLGRPHIYAI